MPAPLGLPRRWTVADSAETYGIRNWGGAYFGRQRGRPRRVHPGGIRVAGHRPEGAGGRGAAPRHRPAAAHPLHGHPASTASSSSTRPSAGPSPSTATRARTGASTRSRSTRTATSSRDRRGGQALPLRPRGRHQARAARGHGHARGRGRAHHLQRLQGRGVHRDGAPRLASWAARSSSWSRSLASSPLIAEVARAHRHRARASACAPSCRRAAPASWEASGGDRSKFGLTSARDDRGRSTFMKDDGPARQLRAAALPPRLARSPPSAVKNALREAGRFYVELHKRARRSSTSTSAAVWASTTTARRRTSPRR